MSMEKTYITIKGTKDGLIFNMDDTCSYQDLILELKGKLNHSHQRFLQSSTINRVTVKLGYRYLSQEQEREVKDLIRTSKGNLVVDKLVSEVVTKEDLEVAKQQASMQVIYKTIRSGQVIQCVGNILVVGDVNPGSYVQATGNIYVMGALRGMVHAGCDGDEEAIIAATSLKPTQIRIANVVSRPPDEWENEEYEMEFAFIHEGQIMVDKLNQLIEIRPMLLKIV